MSDISLRSTPIQKMVTETLDRTMFCLTGYFSRAFQNLLEKAQFFQRAPTGQCLILSDNVLDLNLSPTTDLLRELYKYPYTSNNSMGLVTLFSC
jgi:hypothetical protein